MKLIIDGRSYEVELQPEGVVINGTAFKTTVLRDNGEATVRVGGRPYKVSVKDEKNVVVDGRSFAVEVSGRPTAFQAPKPVKAAVKAAEKGGGKGAVLAMMPGTVLALRVKEGQEVTEGTVLLILEAMKMQNDIKAPHAGVVKHIAVAAGQTVKNGDVLVTIE